MNTLYYCSQFGEYILILGHPLINNEHYAYYLSGNSSLYEPATCRDWESFFTSCDVKLVTSASTPADLAILHPELFI